jgi:hypothetical protein
MDRRERRRRKREQIKIEERLVKKSAAMSAEKKGKQGLFEKIRSKSSLAWKLVAGVMAIFGWFVLFHPHVSLEPDRPLNPGDPFSTLFRVKNESKLFAIRDLTSTCHTIDVITSHNVGISGIARPLLRTIPLMEPQSSSTIDCPPMIGGLGAGAGNVLKAEIVIDVSYRQNWWPSQQKEQFPFVGVRDSQNAVSWSHRTLSELK